AIADELVHHGEVIRAGAKEAKPPRVDRTQASRIPGTQRADATANAPIAARSHVAVSTFHGEDDTLSTVADRIAHLELDGRVGVHRPTAGVHGGTDVDDSLHPAQGAADRKDLV